MKASELRIGNLIHNKQGNIVYVNTNHLTLLSYGIENEFNPIPLTEEWLLKFGFEKNKEHGYFEFDRLIVALHDGVDQFYLCDIDIFVKIETVHHLQNLYFAIRNKELTLKS
jgi:hypothetical protein